VLLFCYLVVPSWTSDIEFTEPRLLLLAAVIGLAAVPWPMTRLRLVLAGWLVTLSLLASVAVLIWAQQYDRSARQWSEWLAQLPPAQHVLVLPDSPPIPAGGRYALVRTALILTPWNFSVTYALEHGGFVSSAFFNGPLKPEDYLALPTYWYYVAGFDTATFVTKRCDSIRVTYDYILVWDLSNPALAQAIWSCYGSALIDKTPLTVWKRP
jgi:hypothetical protein